MSHVEKALANAEKKGIYKTSQKKLSHVERAIGYALDTEPTYAQKMKDLGVKTITAKTMPGAEPVANIPSRAELKAQLADAKERMKQNRTFVLDSSAPYDAAALEELRAKMQAQAKALRDQQNIEAALELSDLRRKYGDTAYTEIEEASGLRDKWKNFWSQSGANAGSMRLSIETEEAFADYAANPTEENKQRALTLRALRDQFNARSAAALDDKGAVLPILSKNAAGYIPQAIDQAKGFAKGGLIGGAVGAGIGAAVGGIPGAVLGVKKGASWGSSIGSGAAMYDDVKGAAIEAFVDAGVPIEIAGQAASQEGILSSAVEALETGVDIKTWGLGTGFKLLLSYLQNIGSEGFEEGVQQGVSIANQKRVKAGEELSLLDLAGDTMGTLLGTIWNANPDEREQILSAAKEGAKTAAVVGGVERVSGTLAERGIDGVQQAVSQSRERRAYQTDPRRLRPMIVETDASTENTPKQTGPAPVTTPEPQNRENEQFEDFFEEANDMETVERIYRTLSGAMQAEPDVYGAALQELERQYQTKRSALQNKTQPSSEPQGLSLPRLDPDPVEVSEEMQAQANRLSAALGRKIAFFSEAKTENGIRNGYYNRAENTIYVNTRSKNPMAQIVAHELTHSVELADSYRSLSDMVFRHLEAEGRDLAKMRADVQKLYADNEAELTEDGVDREIIAQYVEEHLLTDEKKIVELVQEEPGLGRKILNWIDGVLAKLGLGSAKERRFLRQARETYARALAQSRDMERRSEARTTVEDLREDYASGKIDDTAFDDALDMIMEEESMLETSLMQNSFSGADEQQMPGRGDGNTRFAGETGLQRVETNGKIEIKSSEVDADGKPVYAKNRDEANIEAADFVALTKLQDRSAIEFDLNPKEARSLTGYVKGMFGILNAKLNAGTITDADMGVAERVISALRKFPTFEGRTYRNLKFETEEKYDAFLAEYAEGNIITLKAFTSTSKRPNGYPLFGDGVVHLAIDGKTGADIADSYGIPRQQEVVLLPGTIIKIDKVTTANDGRPLIYVQEETNYGLENNHGDGRSARSLEGDRNQSGKRESVGRGDYGQSGRVRRTAWNQHMGDGVLSGRRSGSEVSSLRLGDAFEEKIDTEKERSSNIQNSFSPSETADAEHEAEAEQPSLVDDLPTKARGYLERAERELMDKISAALSIPNRTKEGRTFLQEISRAVSEEFLREGIVSEETVERLFEDAYDRGIVIDDTYYKQYKDIKEHLRRTALTISDTDKADIPDYGQWKKQAFGTLRIIKKGGLPVDTAYEELRGMAPELFPEELTHPADQLMKMYEVGKSIEKAEYSLDQAYGAGAADFKTYRRNDFGAAIDDLAGELRQVRRYADERQAEREMAEAERNAPEPTMDEIMRTYRALKAARKVQERALTKHLLTEHDQVQVGRLLRGELELEHLDPAKDNVAGIRAVYEAKAEYEKYAKQISAWNRHRKALLREQADSFLETANDWNDKKMGILYSRETMERNIRDIVPNEELAEQIIATYFAPVHKAQAEATRMKNTYRARVAALNLSRDVAEGNNVSEAHAVQLLGEAEDNIRMMEQSRGRMKMRDGRTLTDWQGVVQDLWANNPNLDERKIREAVSEFRRIYDELFSAMNESRVRNGYEPVNYRSGYFPHFQPGDDAGILQIFGRALGIEMGVSALPTTINGLTHTFRPGIQWFGNAQERLGYNTAYDAVEGFDRYIEGVADVVHQTDNIQRLRALASQIRYRTSDAGIQEQVDAIKNNKELADRDKENRIKELYESGRFTLSRFVDELDEYTNLLANKKSKGDRAMESALGREMYTFMKGLESRVAANMVAVNPGSWLTNFIPLVQGWGMLDTDTLLRGMWGTLQAYKADDGIVGRSTFLTNRRGSDPLVQTWQQKTSAKLSTPMEYIDNFTADSLVRARYYQNLKRGISEDAALEEADAWTAGVMADRSKGSMPTLFSRSNPLIKPFTQFQLEVNNQLGYIFKDMVPEQRKLGKKALAKALIKFALGAWLYNEIYEYFIGRRPALDPIGILIDAVEDGFGKDFPEISDLLTGDFHTEDVEKKKPYEVINGVAEEVAGQLPFMTGLTLMGIESDVGRLPVSSAIPNFENLNKALTNTDWADGKRWAVGVKEVAKPLTYLAFPFGGGQVKKIWQGVAAMVKGGSYTKDEDGNDILQYPVYNDTPKQIALNTAGALLFGKTALSTGRDWVESGFKNMGVKDTACYQALLDFGVEGETAFDLLQELRGAEKTEEEESVATNKRKILYEAEVPKEAKAIIYRTTMTDSDKEIALLDLFVEEEWDVGTAGEVLLLMKDEKKAVAKRTAIIESALTDEEKKTVFRYMMGDRQEDGTYASGRDADIEAFERAGLDIDQFLRIYNRYAEIEDAYDDNRATIFAKWLDDQGFSTRQEELAKETFKYFNFTPDTAKRYEDFTGYGIESDDAYALDGSLDALTGKELSSSELKLEKYQTIVDSDLAESDQLAAFWTVAGTDAERRRLQTIEAFDVSLESFVAAKKKLAEGAADGEQKQPEVTEIIRSMTGLSNAEKAVLWQLLGSGWSYKNNPFSTSVGKRVLEMIEALKEAPEMLSLPSPDDDAPVQVVPPLSLARP